MYELDPEMHGYIVELLTQKNESEVVRYFKQVSEIENVDPVSLISKEIERNEFLIEKTTKEASTLIKKKVLELKAAHSYFNPRRVSEHRILNHDFTLQSRSEYFDKIYDNESVKDYSLGDNRILRLRLLHPDQFEHILGTDMIYEQFDLARNRVRFIQLQYKAWDNKTLYLDERMLKQINKMSGHLCQSGFCKGDVSSNNDDYFRFPYCSGFLRPTSNMQNSNSKMITTGDHIPVCKINNLAATYGKVTKENIVGTTVGHKIFEDTFINNTLGSRWITIDDLEEFYTSRGIFSELDNIKLRVQEVIYETDEQKVRRLGRS